MLYAILYILYMLGSCAKSAIICSSFWMFAALGLKKYVILCTRKCLYSILFSPRQYHPSDRFRGPNRRPTAHGGLWSPTRDPMRCILSAIKVRSHCPSTYEAHVSLRTCVYERCEQTRV